MRQLIFIMISTIFLQVFLTAAAWAEEERTFIRMEEVEIIGVVEHPEITYIIPKTRVRFNRMPLQRSFRDQIEGLVDPLATPEEIRIRSALKVPSQQ